MDRSIYIIPLVSIGIFFCLTASTPLSSVYAGDPIADNPRKTDQTPSRNAQDEAQSGRQQELSSNKGLKYAPTIKDQKPKGVSFIRLKPKSEVDGTSESQKVFDVVFMDDETSGQTIKRSPEEGPYMKLEKIEDPEKNNILVRKATEKDYKTEMSMGVKMSPYSEIYLGKGFLINRKDDFNVDPRDNGWRLKFKFNF